MLRFLKCPPPLARKVLTLEFSELPSPEAMVPLDTVDFLAMNAAYEGGGGPLLDVESIPRASGGPPIGVKLIP